MANPFKELDDLDEPIKAPSSIKHKVMGSYGFITNIAKVVEFIVGSLGNVCTGMLKLFDPSSSTQPPPIMGLGSFNINEDGEDGEDGENGENGEK